MPADPAQNPQNSVSHAIGFREFVALSAALMSCQALAIDAMLPALPEIARELGITDPNHSQWILTTYMAGLGLGQLFWGMVSDRVGRRPVLLIGLALYAAAASLAGLAETFGSLLGLRFVHGVAAASVVIARSVIRDLYGGRQMARVMSLTFIVFIMVPIVAPSLGQLVLLLAPWRFLFAVFGIFAAITWLWVLIRLPETLRPEYRVSLTAAHVAHAVGRVVRDRASLWYTLAVTVMFGSILAYISMVQQIFATVFGKPSLMPSMFALCAAAMGVTAFVNSRIVERVGMRAVSQTGLIIFIAATFAHVLVLVLGLEQLWTFVALQAIVLGSLGLIIANFGAMAMESMKSVAGVAASLQGFMSTSGGALVGAWIGRYFNGTTVPLAVGQAACGIAALLLVLIAEQGRLFRPHHDDPHHAAVRTKSS